MGQEVTFGSNPFRNPDSGYELNRINCSPVHSVGIEFPLM